jgi:hypothetical protein
LSYSATFLKKRKKANNIATAIAGIHVALPPFHCFFFARGRSQLLCIVPGNKQITSLHSPCPLYKPRPNDYSTWASHKYPSAREEEEEEKKISSGFRNHVLWRSGRDGVMKAPALVPCYYSGWLHAWEGCTTRRAILQRNTAEKHTT